MAVWNSDSMCITKAGEEVLSQVQLGNGKLTVSRVVSGGGYVSPAQLYKQTEITDIKQELYILDYNTTTGGSSLEVGLNNDNLTEAYDLYQIGVYVTHPDFAEEVLYLIAQCDTSSPDHIPVVSETPVTLNYSLYLTHSGTAEVTINVSQVGSISPQIFNEFKEEVNQNFISTLGCVAEWDTEEDITDLVLSTDKSGIVWIGDKVTGMPIDNLKWFGFLQHHGNDKRLTVYHQDNKHSVFVKTYSNNKWTSWRSLASGGNADTVDGLHANAFMRWTADMLDGDILTWASAQTVPTCISKISNTGTAPTDSPFSDGNTEAIYFVYMLSGGRKLVHCYAYHYSNNFTSSVHFTRVVSGNAWSSGWCNVADGGNADTLDGKNASNFVENMSATGGYYSSTVFGDHTYITNNISSDIPNVPAVSNYHHIILRNSDGAILSIMSIPVDYTKNVYVYRAHTGEWTKVADGGNADTVDGKHSTDFVATHPLANYDCNTLFDAGLYLVSNGTNTPPDCLYGSLLVMPYRKPYGNETPDFVAQIYMPNGDCKRPSLWYRLSLANEFGEWNEVLSYENIGYKFVMYKGGITDTELLNNAAYTGAPYEGVVYGDAADSMGLSEHFWHIKYMRHYNGDGHGLQIAFPLSSAISNWLPRYRTSAGTTWSAWKCFADGGNAATVNSKTVLSDVPANAKFTDTVYTHPNGTAKTGNPTANQTPGFGGTFTVTQFTSNATGHITGAVDRTVKIPSTAMTAATASAAGKTGLVPAPAAGKQESFLRGDGSWNLPTVCAPRSGDWRLAPGGMSIYNYESANTTTYSLPCKHCYVLVMRISNGRGTALAFGWANSSYPTYMWRSNLHDDTQSNKWTAWSPVVAGKADDTYSATATNVCLRNIVTYPSTTALTTANVPQGTIAFTYDA